jgi:uncharacterized protein GlcG (DUF336 family)
MRLSKAVLIASLFALPIPASAQTVLMERNISLELARIMADASLAQCKTDGFDVTVVVVDRTGEPRLLLRANSSNPHNLDLARRKAYTSRTFGITSLEFGRRTEQGQPLSGQRQLVDVIPLGGGVPVVVAGERIGGIGVSGATSQEADEKCAQAGLAAAAAYLR